jgi:GH25 family lysozyme M1 (1,4-beta-N-acetylmuramidase)
MSKQFRGIDIHPIYQREIDWPQVRSTNLVDFAYVQVSRGGSLFKQDFEGKTYTSDKQVLGAFEIGLKLGGYHFALNDVPPELQAATFATEVYKFGLLGLPPMLDLEKPFVHDDPWTVTFGKRFLSALIQQGFPQVCIYGNAFFLSKIRPHEWGVPGLVIWGADYAMTDDVPNPIRYYDGPLDIRQYSSQGKIAGIGPGFVDLNYSDLAFLRFIS